MPANKNINHLTINTLAQQEREENEIERANLTTQRMKYEEKKPRAIAAAVVGFPLTLAVLATSITLLTIGISQKRNGCIFGGTAMLIALGPAIGMLRYAAMVAYKLHTLNQTQDNLESPADERTSLVVRR